MNTSALYPPNIDRLGDAAIGEVLQRVSSTSRSANRRQWAPEGDTTNDLESYSPQKQQRPRNLNRTTRGSAQVDEPAALSGTTKRINTRARSPATDRPSSPMSVAECKRIINRKRRRIYQQRYRKKLCGRETTCEEDIAQLRGDVRKLQFRRQLVLSGIPTQPTAWQVVAEYFSLFRNGLKSLVITPDFGDDCASISNEDHVQKNFLEANMTPAVTVNSGFGVETLLAEWERLRVCFPDLSVQLVNLEHGEGDAVMAVSKRSAILTEQALRNAFPHLVTTEGWSPVAAKLLGQQFVVLSTARFEWDEANAQISGVYSTTDIVTPLLQLLGNLEDVATVLKNSHSKRQ